MRHLKSNFISLFLHFIVISIFLLNIKNPDILTPSRSDGIEVSLISRSTVEAPSIINPQLDQISNVVNNADINIKKNEQEINPTPPISPVKPNTTPTPNKKNIEAPDLTNELLDQLDNIQSTNDSRGKAVGGNTSGTSNSDSLVSNYADQVINAVRPYVNIPDNIDNSISAVVEVILLPNMKVYKTRLKKSSGNDIYDSNIIEAIKRVNIFPPLPDNANFVDFRVLYLNFKPE